MAILPLLKDAQGNNTVVMGEQSQDGVPFLCSVMNTANRIPANVDFDRSREMNLQSLQVAFLFVKAFGPNVENTGWKKATYCVETDWVD